MSKIPFTACDFCGHNVWDHYDGVYCLEGDCRCGPCDTCDKFAQLTKTGECFICRQKTEKKKKSASVSSKVR